MRARLINLAAGVIVAVTIGVAVSVAIILVAAFARALL